MRSPLNRTRSGLSAATAVAIRGRSGLMPVVVFFAGSRESPNTTNVQVPDAVTAGDSAAAGTVRTGAEAGPEHPEKQTTSTRIRKSVNVYSRMSVCFNLEIHKNAVVTHPFPAPRVRMAGEARPEPRRGTYLFYKGEELRWQGPVKG
jgi:hypothetical protein